MPIFTTLSRRSFFAAAGAAALAPSLRAQQNTPPDYVPRDWSGQVPVRYPDPDVIALDNRFRRYIIGNTIYSNCTSGINVEGTSGNYVVENNIAVDNAKVRYRVVREVRYPPWYGWRYWWRPTPPKF